MCDLTFGPDDIARWARFSGDYNPIHFNPDRARQLGVDGVIAHGMLVLHAIKGRLSQAMPREAGGWWLLRSRMRQPVVAEKPTQLEMNQRGDGLAYSLTSLTGRKLMTGSLGRLTEDPDVQNPGAPNHLSAEVVGVRVRELNYAFPLPREFWVDADALVFAEFLRTGIKDVLAPHGIDLSGGEVPSDTGTVAVQTTHEIAFDRDFLAVPKSVSLDLEVLPPQTEDVEDGVVATCQLVSRCEGRIVMVTSLGLFIRQNAHAPAPKRSLIMAG